MLNITDNISSIINMCKISVRRTPYCKGAEWSVQFSDKTATKDLNYGYRPVLITVPNLIGQGGVSGYFNAILPHLKKEQQPITTLEIGSIGKSNPFFNAVHDQLSFRQKCAEKPSLVHINPSLGKRSFWRDGLYSLGSKKKRLPTISFFHGWNNDFASIVENKYLAYFNKTFKNADGFIVLSQEFKIKLRQWGVKAPIFLNRRQ